LKQLQRQEDMLRDYGHWSEADLLEYVAGRLRAVDELIYAPENFAGLYEIDELARAQIAGGSVAVACQSEADIDAVQRQLQRIYGQRLGILIFQDGASAYRVRRVDRNLPATLERAYERLNLLDPAATGGSENRWCGSSDDGASPRKSRTGLTATQITEAVREAFWQPTFVDVVSAIPQVLFVAVAALSPALAVTFVGNLLRDRGLITGETALLSAVVLTITVAILFWSKARQVPGLNGWRVPAGFSWLSMLPAALVGAAAGGIWAPGSIVYRMGPDNLSQVTGVEALLFPLAAELLFRGVILGHLAARLPIQKSGGPWWRSWPTVISTALYAVASVLLFVSLSRGEIQISQSLLIVGGAVIFGIASGIARERSESILASVLLHWLCTAALILSGRWLF
jgi:membrane protease YdiL (CAAX protease family)